MMTQNKRILLPIPDKNYAAYIFDCDGTLVDSMPAHFESWGRAIRSCEPSFDFTWELFYSLAGMGLVHTVEEINRKYGLSVDPLTVVSLKDRYFLESLGQVRPKPEVIAYAQEAYGKIKMAVASGGNREVVENILVVTGLMKYFDAVVTQDDVVNGKPSPDIFLCAAEKLNVPAEKCLVFEDADLGILAAQRAGMDFVKVD